LNYRGAFIKWIVCLLQIHFKAFLLFFDNVTLSNGLFFHEPLFPLNIHFFKYTLFPVFALFFAASNISITSILFSNDDKLYAGSTIFSGDFSKHHPICFSQHLPPNSLCPISLTIVIFALLNYYD